MVFDNNNNGFIYHIFDGWQLVEHNMLTKQNHILRMKLEIIDFYMTDRDIIIITKKPKRGGPIIPGLIVIWNNIKIYINISFIRSTGFIWINNDIHVWFNDYYSMFILNRNESFAEFKRIDFAVSQNMKRILLHNDNFVTIMNNEPKCDNLNFRPLYYPIKSYNPPHLFEIQQSKNVICKSQIEAIWVGNSDRLISFNNGYEVINVDTLNKCILNHYEYEYDDNTNNNLNFLVEIPNNIFLAVSEYYIDFYEINTMTLLKKMKCKKKLIGYSCGYNVLFTRTYDYYCITRDLELDKITIRQNYLTDKNYTCSRIKTIMEIILDDYLLFSYLPREILNIELYLANTKNINQAKLKPIKKIEVGLCDIKYDDTFLYLDHT